MISTQASPRRPLLGLAVIVGLGLSALSLPALAGVGDGEPRVSIRGAEAAPQLVDEDSAAPANKADAPLVVADKYKSKNWNNNWDNPNWNKNKNWNNNNNWTNSNKTGTRITRTNTGTRISSMCGLGSRDLITASSSAASFSARS
jgi:hypothetical protein